MFHLHFHTWKVKSGLSDDTFDDLRNIFHFWDYLLQILRRKWKNDFSLCFILNLFRSITILVFHCDNAHFQKFIYCLFEEDLRRPILFDVFEWNIIEDNFFIDLKYGWKCVGRAIVYPHISNQGQHQNTVDRTLYDYWDKLPLIRF